MPRTTSVFCAATQVQPAASHRVTNVNTVVRGPGGVVSPGGGDCPVSRMRACTTAASSLTVRTCVSSGSRVESAKIRSSPYACARRIASRSLQRRPVTFTNQASDVNRAAMPSGSRAFQARANAAGRFSGRSRGTVRRYGYQAPPAIRYGTVPPAWAIAVASGPIGTAANRCVAPAASVSVTEPVFGSAATRASGPARS